VSSVNQQLLVSTLVIAIGWILRRTILGEADTLTLVKVVFNVTLPALVIHTLGRATLEPSLALLPVLAVAHGLFMAALATQVLFRKRARKERGELSMLMPGLNIGLFAYPFVEGTLGPEALKILGMFDVGVALCAFGIAFAIASHYARPEGAIEWRHVLGRLARSVPMVAYAASLVVGLAGLRWPELLLEVAAVPARANRPLALLLLGMTLDLSSGAGRWGDVARALGARYAVGLAAGVALYLTLPFDPLFRTVVLVCFALPPPLITLSYAVQFGYDHRFVGLLQNVANVVSYVLLWIIFAAVA